MSKTKKILAGTAIGTTAAVGALTAVAYELMLNIELSRKVKESFTVKPRELSEEEQKEASAALPDNKPFLDAVAKWHESHTATDLYIENKKGQKRHAKFFDNGHNDRWVIVFHGYTSGPESMYHYPYCYDKMGFNCILCTMIGHGKDENSHCSMGYHDRYMGLDWIDYIISMYPDAKIVLHGESMGAATTMLITGESLPDNVKAAVADCGFTNAYKEYIHAAKYQASPALIPLVPLVSIYSELRGNFNFKKCSPVDAVKNSKTPTLFVHGESDDFVPYYMLQEVYDACAAKKEKLSVKGAEHAQSSTVSPDLYWSTVEKFHKENGII